MARGKDFEAAGLNLIEFYRNNPVIAAEELLNVDLDAIQKIVLEDLWFKLYTLITAGRGSGKTFLLAVFAALRGMLYPGDKIGLLSPSFRQSKLVFEEVRKRYEEAPLLREACAQRPTLAADRCFLRFRAPTNRVGSTIEALPLGTGEKIRGARYYSLLCDEFAQIPEEIVDVVIRPMGATAANPMERVKRKKRVKLMLEAGIDVSEFVGEAVNKFIGVSSAFYTFNHMYKRIQRYEEEIAVGSKDHAVRFISHEDMSEGFLDEKNIKEARASMPAHLFQMEYEGIWKSDSEGHFKASLLEASKKGSCGIKIKASAGKRYLMGVDPARSSDAFAICIIEVGETTNNLVYARKSTRNKFPQMADIIYDLAEKFNVEEILMDAGAGGGGLALKDILANAEVYGKNAILDMEDPEYLETTGRKILKMFNPSPKTNAEAVYSALTLLEQKELKLPNPPLSGNEEEDEVYDTMVELNKQLISIVMTQTASGTPRFDVQGGSGHGGAKKDLYSAFILVCKLLYEQIYHIQEDYSIHSVGGLLIPRGSTPGYF
jgi:phage terminase large subunit-like protein